MITSSKMKGRKNTSTSDLINKSVRGMGVRFRIVNLLIYRKSIRNLSLPSPCDQNKTGFAQRDTDRNPLYLMHILNLPFQCFPIVGETSETVADALVRFPLAWE